MKTDKYIDIFIPDLSGQTMIVTGANSGIGYQCALTLAKKHAKVVLACRNQNRAEEAKNNILKVYPNSDIEILLYDQSSFASIDKLVENITHKYSNFDAIILNAGIYRPQKGLKTADGFPLTIGTNFFGLYYLMKKLSPFLEVSTKQRRIVIQGSLAARRVKYKPNKDLLLSEKKNLMYQYALSKLGSMNVFYHFANENTNPYIFYYLSEPGVTYTNILRGFPRSFQKAAKFFLNIFTHSVLSASLSATLLAANNCFPNGAVALPKGAFHVRGKPKVYPKFKQKCYPLMIKDTETILSSYLKK